MKSKKIVVPVGHFICLYTILAFLTLWFSLWGLKMYADEIGADGAAAALVETATTTAIYLGSIVLILICASRIESMSKNVRIRITIPRLTRRRS